MSRLINDPSELMVERRPVPAPVPKPRVISCGEFVPPLFRGHPKLIAAYLSALVIKPSSESNKPS